MAKGRVKGGNGKRPGDKPARTKKYASSASRESPVFTNRSRPTVNRTAFQTSRLLEFCSQKELTAQAGHSPKYWPEVIVKELVDNALDASEEAGVSPEIQVAVDGESITVTDNGPGLPASTLDGILDYTTRTSSREAYVAPDRGAQGNALKTILAMPFALDGESGLVHIHTGGKRYGITFQVDPIRQEPVVCQDVKRDRLVKNGTRIKVWWPSQASSIMEKSEGDILQVVDDFAFLNPHLDVAVKIRDDKWIRKAVDPEWGSQKWTPSSPTCPHWYGSEDLERLVAAYLGHDADRGADRPVREFIKEFAGLTGSAKQKKVLEATGLARMPLSALRNGAGLDHRKVNDLLQAMQDHSKVLRPPALGVIGKENILGRFLAELDGDEDSFRYRKVSSVDEDGLPFVVEVAFAWCPDLDGRRLITGVNWSPAIGGNPFRDLNDGYGLDGLLVDQRCGPNEPVAVLVHLATPRARYTDRGKSAIVLDNIKTLAIEKAVSFVTSQWCKQRKAEEREANRAANRRDALRRARRISIKEAVWKVIPDAYAKASGGGQYPAKTRQVYYAARPEILRLTGKEKLDQQYISQKPIRDYLDTHPDETADWDIVFDARGSFYEPHTGTRTPLGTLEVRSYLTSVYNHVVKDPTCSRLSTDFPTCGPEHRFGGLLFCEKEGFNELFARTQIAERYDLGIMSTKGVSVGACRRLADEICGRYGIPLLVLHDFDKAGFTTLGTLKRDSRVYHYKNDIQVIDLGLRLEDVTHEGLQTEPVCYGRSRTTGMPKDPEPNLRKNGASDEEVEFLRGQLDDLNGYQGHRVEINAFTSPDLIRWLERKLEEAGICKVVPDHETLELAFRRAAQIAIANDPLATIMRKAENQATKLKIPGDLVAKVEKRLAERPSLPWDRVLADIAEVAICKNRHNSADDQAC